jgi:D-glycero-D-manno-heptose 1,7-bisphosphate phosphatase
MRKAVFLDRDGTLIEEAGYLERLERLIFFPYSVDAVRQLNRGGFAVIVITNQAGIGRGIVKESFVAEAHRHIRERLEAGGARVDAFYYCPHHPDAVIDAFRQRCDCRKPGPGMLKAAAEDLHLDLARSFVVGDRCMDVEAGRAAGATPVLVRTGYGRMEEPKLKPDAGAAVVTDNLIEAVSWILHQS